MKNEKYLLTKKDKILQKLQEQKISIKKLKATYGKSICMSFKVNLEDSFLIQKKALKKNLTPSQFLRELVLKELKGGLKNKNEKS